MCEFERRVAIKKTGSTYVEVNDGTVIVWLIVFKS